MPLILSGHRLSEPLFLPSARISKKSDSSSSNSSSPTPWILRLPLPCPLYLWPGELNQGHYCFVVSRDFCHSCHSLPLRDRRPPGFSPCPKQYLERSPLPHSFLTLWSRSNHCMIRFQLEEPRGISFSRSPQLWIWPFSWTCSDMVSESSFLPSCLEPSDVFLIIRLSRLFFPQGTMFLIFFIYHSFGSMVCFLIPFYSSTQ